MVFSPRNASPFFQLHVSLEEVVTGLNVCAEDELGSCTTLATVSSAEFVETWLTLFSEQLTQGDGKGFTSHFKQSIGCKKLSILAQNSGKDVLLSVARTGLKNSSRNYDYFILQTKKG